DPIQPPRGPDANPGYYPPAGPAQRTNLLALIGFIFSLSCLGAGFISLILCIFGLVQINKTPHIYKGKGLAVTGIVFSGLAILMTVMYGNLGYGTPGLFYNVSDWFIHSK
ncbi:MAG: DUF4190 domain-containing protein, partial [Actinobacteria bacterium]|nr:DUF4190 domain-containing protein [Actinomycetota bacterium]